MAFYWGWPSNIGWPSILGRDLSLKRYLRMHTWYCWETNRRFQLWRYWKSFESFANHVFTLQNVTNKYILFNYHLIYLKENFSIHFQIHSLNKNVFYLLIYKFDSLTPQLTSSINNIDGWSLLCYPNNDEIFTFFINNNQTLNHYSIIFGIRELTRKEIEIFCGKKEILNPPIIDKPLNFSSNYEIWTYLSTCFYLGENNHWHSDGLLASFFLF
jgi:hypothetical protein